MGTWLKDKGTDFKRVPPAIFGLIWASERIMTVMSHREPFLKESLSESTVTLKRREDAAVVSIQDPPHTHTGYVFAHFPQLGAFFVEVLEIRTYCQAGRFWAQRAERGDYPQLQALIRASASWSGYCARSHTLVQMWPRCFTMTDRSRWAVSWNKSLPSHPA